MKKKLFLLSIVLGAATVLPAKTLYVKTGGDDTGDGLSWATAKATVAGALDEATANDRVFVAQGAYQLTAEISIREGINVYGGFEGTETSLEQRPALLYGKTAAGKASILDGKASANVRRRVLSQSAPFSVETVWDGFVIQNGYVTELEGGGGGAFLRNKGILNNCTVTQCTSPLGGGIYGDEDATVSNCLITGNLSGGRGGGLTLYKGSKAVSCMIVNNTSEMEAGGAYASREDGAKYARCSMINCLVANNTAMTGGGILCNIADIINCTVVNNVSTHSGSGIRTSQEYAVITNCLVWGNKGSNGSSANQVGGDESAATRSLTYCAIEGGYTRNGAGDGIIDLEAANTGSGNYPAFKQPSAITGYSPIPANIAQILAADWSIGEASVCRNAGTPVIDGLILPGRDLAGNERIGENRIDIGAYEAGNRNSLPSITAGAVKIYSNPVSDKLFIEATGNASPVRLYNPAGKQLLQTQKKEIDFSGFASGLYLLKINNQTIKVFKK
jgi:hypothetical protein